MSFLYQLGDSTGMGIFWATHRSLYAMSPGAKASHAQFPALKRLWNWGAVFIAVSPIGFEKHMLNWIFSGCSKKGLDFHILGMG